MKQFKIEFRGNSNQTRVGVLTNIVSLHDHEFSMSYYAIIPESISDTEAEEFTNAMSDAYLGNEIKDSKYEKWTRTESIRKDMEVHLSNYPLGKVRWNGDYGREQLPKWQSEEKRLREAARKAYFSAGEYGRIKYYHL